MSPWFNLVFAAGMIVAPALFLLLWCLWTGVRGILRPLLVTLATLLLFGLSALVLRPASFQPFYFAWGMAGFFLLTFGFVTPSIRRAFAALPATPQAASLKPRRVELFKGAWVWPFLAWAVLAALAFVRGLPLFWLGPLIGLVSLVLLRAFLPLTVLEPEPLGGDDPEALAQRYRSFRRRRVLMLYWVMVLLSLFVSGGVHLFGGNPAWVGSLGGALLGFGGAAFGTWADAQRYLLRLQLSGGQPPA